MLQVSEKEEISWAATQKAKNFFSSTHARKRETQKSFFCLLLFFLQVRFRLSIQKRREIRRIYLSFLSKIYGRPLLGRHWLFIAPIFRGEQYFFIFLRNRLANLFLAREAVVLLDRERECWREKGIWQVTHSTTVEKERLQRKKRCLDEKESSSPVFFPTFKKRKVSQINVYF